jgi:hypothetical protein
LGKGYGIKGCYLKQFAWGTHGNLRITMRAYWEPMGTWLEYQNEKKTFQTKPPFPLATPKEIKA